MRACRRGVDLSHQEQTFWSRPPQIRKQAEIGSYTRNASRETSGSRRRGWLLGAAALVVLGSLAAGCSQPAKPRGWAAAVPVEVASRQAVLVPHKGKVYALPEGSGAQRWQFPPDNKETYPISELGAERIRNRIDATGLESTAKKELDQRVDDLRLEGPTKDALKSAIDATEMTDDEKRDVTGLIEESVKFEADALKNLRAIYGDIGLTEDEGTAYVATFRGMLFALDTESGTMRWVRDAGEEIVGGVAVDGERIFVGTRGNRLFALDGRNGDQVWRFEARDQIWATPLIDGDTVYGTSLEGTVFALNKNTGERVWEFTGARSGIAGRPALEDGTLYVGAFDNRLYAVDAADGSMKWSFKARNWFWSTPEVEGDLVYAGSLDGRMYALRADDGTEAWSFNTGAPVRSAPVVVGGGLVVAARDAQLFKLDLETGEAMPGSPVLVGDESKVEADLTAGSEGRVYVVPRGAWLYVFEAAEGLRSLGGFPLN